jgi:hypothetical protein
LFSVIGLVYCVCSANSAVVFFNMFLWVVQVWATHRHIKGLEELLRGTVLLITLIKYAQQDTEPGTLTTRPQRRWYMILISNSTKLRLKFTKVQIPPYATSVLVFSLFIILFTLYVSACLWAIFRCDLQA